VGVRVGNKTWKCSRCGNELTIDNPPEVCPICEGLNTYYEIPESLPEKATERGPNEEGVIE